MKNPVINFWPDSPALDSWDLALDNPNWGNNAEASTSSRYKRLRLQLIQAFFDTSPKIEAPRMEENKEIVVYNQKFALQQILEHLHPLTHNPAP